LFEHGELHVGAGIKLSPLVFETPPALAVTVADWLALTCAALAAKLTVVCPELMDALAGTVRFVLLLLSETANPAAGAPCVIVTVQEVLPGVLIVVAVQVNPLSCAVVVRLSVAVLVTPA